MMWRDTFPFIHALEADDYRREAGPDSSEGRIFLAELDFDQIWGWSKPFFTYTSPVKSRAFDYLLARALRLFSGNSLKNRAVQQAAEEIHADEGGGRLKGGGDKHRPDSQSSR